MSAYLDLVAEQAEQVRREEAQREAARRRADEQAARKLAEEATAKILAAVGRQREPVSPPHAFSPHGSEYLRHSCVRCPYAKDHAIHRGAPEGAAE